MCTSGLFNVFSNYGFSLCGVFSHDVMAANDMLVFESKPVDAGLVSDNAVY